MINSTLTPQIGITKLSRYGVHTDSNQIKSLYQDTCPYGWNFFGVEPDKSQSVKHLRNGCSHVFQPSLALRSIPNKHWEIFKSLIDDPLIRVLLPIPNGGCYFLDTRQLPNYTEWLSCLERLNSPLHSWVKPFWVVSLKKLAHQLNLTNLHPIVLTDIGQQDLSDVLKVIQTQKASPRTLLLTSDEDLVLPNSVKRISTELNIKTDLATLIKLPLEHIGVNLLSDYCKDTLKLEA